MIAISANMVTLHAIIFKWDTVKYLIAMSTVIPLNLTDVPNYVPSILLRCM